jgi:neutral ceramidase
MRALTLLALAALAALLHGCYPTYVTAPVSARVELEGRLMAGVAETDITPPPGLALFGHGPEGRVATGFLTRLRCQAFVLGRDVDALALVTCDLGAPSIELQRAVATRVRARGVPIGAERILLMATHTHAGPAHYFGAANYSGPFGARLTGYDEDLVEWLAERIAETIGNAYGRLAPACAGWGVHSENGTDEEKEADRARIKLLGLTRNRSYAAFSANLQARVDLNVCGELGGHAMTDPFAELTTPTALDVPRRRAPSDYAVDRTLSVLRIDDCSDSPVPLGVLAVYGMHPTAIANTNDLYHGDVFGFATRALRDLLEEKCPAGAKCPRPIVGIANGIEGDVSPAWGYQGLREARRIGGVLAHLVGELQGRDSTRPRADFAVRAAYRELVLPCAAVEAPDVAFYAELCADPSSALCLHSHRSKPPRLCREPLLGTPAAGGAEDGPTRLRVFSQMHEGHRAPDPDHNSCHTHKVPLLAPLRSRERECTGPLGYLDDLSQEFPALVPITVAHLGDAMLVATPAELTTMTGIRLRQRLGKYLEQLRAPVEHVVVTGLTNSWLQYIATAEEYAQQHYEGASTLYGPHSELFLNNHAVCLTNWLFGDRTRDEECRLGQEMLVDVVYPTTLAPLRAERLGEAPDDLDEWLEQHDLVVDDAHPFEGIHAYRIHWRGVPPSWVRAGRRLRVTIRSTTGSDRVLADDQGSSLVIRNDGEEWHAMWFPEYQAGVASCQQKKNKDRDAGPDTKARFEVHDVTERRSNEFTIWCNGTPPTGVAKDEP